MISKLSPWVIGLLQATGFLLYTVLIGQIMIHGNQWFPQNQSIFGPMLFLSLFVVSGIICASLILGYPIYVFWEKKNFKLAARIVAFSTGWLLLFIIIILSCLLLAPKP